MVIPFDPIYPPMNGGTQRCFNLLNQLCKHFETTALMTQDRQSFMKAADEFPAIKNCRILSTRENKNTWSLFLLIPAKFRDAVKFRIWNRSLTEPAESSYLSLYPQLKEFLRSNPVDYIILEDMSILSLTKLIRRMQPSVPIVYDAYNVNSTLAAVAVEKGLLEKKQYDSILRDELTLYKKVRRIFTCSVQDLEQLRKMNEDKLDGAVIPNGVGIPEKLNGRGSGLGSQHILFCGSMDYLPNQEGLLWFCKEVFPRILEQLPSAKLLVVGKGDPGAELNKLLVNPSIVNYGRVDRVETYYHQSAMAVVPLLSGSGTRLKLLESMALGVPVVSTSSGAEGIHYTDGKNILIADDALLFAHRVVEMLNQPSMARQIAAEAFAFVQHEYDWNIVGEKMEKYLTGLKKETNPLS